MLGKLLKYDMRYVSRIMLIVYIIVLSISLFISGLIFLSFKVAEFSVLLLMTLPIGILAVAGVSASGVIMIAVRIYKNLYSDQGYLTFTLPVSSNHLIWGKVILYAIWQISGMAVAVICVAIPVAVTVSLAGEQTIDTVKYLFDFICFNIRDTLGFVGSTFNVLAVAMIVYYLISFISAPIIMIFAFSIGQLASKHKILLAMVAYYGYSMVSSTIFTVVEIILSLIASNILYAPAGELALTEMTLFYSIISTISLVLTSICYVMTKNIMDNKLNLT